MILRRFMKHVSDQNWFAVGLDVLVVITGIFLGMQVTEWNDNHLTDQQRNQVEDRLIADFHLIDEEIGTAVKRMERQLVDIEIFRQALLRGSLKDGEESAILHALSRGYSYPSFASRSPTYLELQTSGRLDLIIDEDFRIALAEYDDNTQQRLFNLRTLRDRIIQSMNPNRFTRLEPLERNDDGDFPILSITDFDFEAMIADEEYLVSIESLLLSQSWIHANVLSARKEVDTILAIIEEMKK